MTGGISGTRDGSQNLTVTFLRRSRAPGQALWSSPLFEETAEFEADILDGSDVVRTITATASANGSVVDPDAMSLFYDADDQTADFGSPQAWVDLRIYQLNAASGRMISVRKPANGEFRLKLSASGLEIVTS